ncbi:hypothetical protein [Microvirga rosea]|uniref:hypothetical protein n=1 Tax=Microvirga rosea TaxID=2715425 RepID=UPI001D0A414D|nr:hypothetical protein [Microvirga rosea]MCB8822807.1 hypothetical protein [Microvirga rosea]
MAGAVGWRSDAVVTECFTLLAVRAMQRIAIHVSFTPGASRPMTGSHLAMVDAHEDWSGSRSSAA